MFESYYLINLSVLWDDELLIKDYLRTTIVDKVVKIDLPEQFRNVNRDLLFTLLEIFYSEPGMYLEYDSISRKLRISKKTLAKHIFYLESSYLLRRVRNYRVGVMSSSKKMQRLYPYWWTLAYCYGDNDDKIMESVVASSLDARHYWRKDGKEIDFLLLDGKRILPVEVKNKEEVSGHDLKPMRYFLEKYSVKEGLVIYNGKELKDRNIRFVPLWRFLLESGFFPPVRSEPSLVSGG